MKIPDLPRTKVVKQEFRVELTGDCKRVFIPKEYCTIYFEGVDPDNLEMSVVGGDICIEHLGEGPLCMEREGDK